MTFSVNPFAVLDESATFSPEVKTQQQPAKAEPKSEVAKKPTGQQKSNAQRSNAGPRQRGGQQVGEKNTEVSMDKPTNHPHHHGPRRGQRGFRGRGRQFDRHSGTHPDSERKVAKAWGEPGTEEAVVDSNTPVDEKAADKVVEAEPVEVEPPVKTLEEYLAEKATITKHALPAPRKANEGEDGNKWKNAVPLVREEVGELFPEIAAKSSTASNSKKPKEVKAKVHVNIEQRFNDTPAASFGGKRGGKQQRQSRGGSRGQRGSVPNISDPSAFPILA